MTQLIETIYTPYIICPIVAMIMIFYALMIIYSRKKKKPEVIPEPEPELVPEIHPIYDKIGESGNMLFM